MSSSKFEKLLALHGSPATSLLGTKIISIDEARETARFTFTAQPSFANMLGNVQGGFVAAMLDEAAGLTIRIVSPPGLVVPTLDFSVRFIRAVRVGPVEAIGRCIRLGRNVAFLEADIVDDKG